MTYWNLGNEISVPLKMEENVIVKISTTLCTFIFTGKGVSMRCMLILSDWAQIFSSLLVYQTE